MVSLAQPGSSPPAPTAAELLAGPVARAMGPAFEPRPEQLRMAREVEEALADRAVLLAEAGTGVGKSYAYLVPAIVRAALMNEVVVIATNTIALQEQIMEKDLPALRAALADLLGPEDEASPRLRPALVKGRGNYLSIRRLQLASQRQELLLDDQPARDSLHIIEDWAYATTDGTLATLPQLPRPAVWEHAQSDTDNCMGKRCPTYHTCFYQAARRAMERANLLVCNHALFFADLALRSRGVGFLPEHHHVILDEAHNAEDVACDHLGLSLTEGRVAHLLRTLYDMRRRKGYLAQLERVPLASADNRVVERAIQATLRAADAAHDFFDAWLHLLDTGELRSGRVRSPNLVDNTLTPAMRDLALSLKVVKDEVQNEEDKFELNAYAKRAGAIADTCDALVTHAQPASVYWVDAGDTDHASGAGGGGARPRRPGRRRVTLACSPIEVGPILAEHLFSRGLGVVLTSATLATTSKTTSPRRRPTPPSPDTTPDAQRFVPDGAPEPEPTQPTHSHEPPTPGSPGALGPFAHAAARLGCKNPRTLQLGSPFTYASQVELYIDRSMPNPRGPAGPRTTPNPAPSYPQALAHRILTHLDATDGGAFVLFTAFDTLASVARLLEAPLAQRAMPLIVQGRDGPRGLLLREFRKSERSVLLGAASFWQGVDVRGHTLRNVIITRLPFDPPDRPLTEARMELIESRGGDPFLEESLPRAILKFKQGFGRLIRSATDRGRVVVLDPRLLTTGYGKRFLEALPPGVPVRVIHDHPA